MRKKIIIYSILLIIFGLIMIYSSSYIWAGYKFNDPYKYVKNQFIFFIVGLFLMKKISKFDYKMLYDKSNKLLIVGLILLVLVLIFGKTRNGSRSWFSLGFISFQPSEIMKLILIIYTSKYLTDHKHINEFKELLPILLITFFIFFLIMLQPDFGTGIIIIMAVFGLLFVSGANLLFFVKLVIFGLIGIIFLIIKAPYRLKRITSFLNPWKDPLGSGFQIIQSLYSIGPGGLFGLGLGKSIQKHFYLPEPQTDFIFSIISEEFGFLGVLIVSTLFILLIVNIIKVSLNCQNKFGKYLSFGIAFSIGFQALLNLMVVTGLIPITGVTLPFLSYGGSSLINSMLQIGIVLSVSYQKKI